MFPYATAELVLAPSLNRHVRGLAFSMTWLLSPFTLIHCAAAASFGVAGLPWQIPAALVVVCSLSLAEDATLRRASAQGSAGTFHIIGTAFVEAGICCLAWTGGAAIGALASL